MRRELKEGPELSLKQRGRGEKEEASAWMVWRACGSGRSAERVTTRGVAIGSPADGNDRRPSRAA